MSNDGPIPGDIGSDGHPIHFSEFRDESLDNCEIHTTEHADLCPCNIEGEKQVSTEYRVRVYLHSETTIDVVADSREGAEDAAMMYLRKDGSYPRSAAALWQRDTADGIDNWKVVPSR